MTIAAKVNITDVKMHLYTNHKPPLPPSQIREECVPALSAL